MKVNTGKEVETPDTARMFSGNSVGSDAMALRYIQHTATVPPVMVHCPMKSTMSCTTPATAIRPRLAKMSFSASFAEVQKLVPCNATIMYLQMTLEQRQNMRRRKGR